jgi:hypothetical protein
MTKVAAKKTAKPAPSQRERALTAIERMPCFDKYWLEKLQEALRLDGADGSIHVKEREDMETLHGFAVDFNERRRQFPKPWVAT